jgi:uncharacterized protein DUF6498
MDNAASDALAASAPRPSKLPAVLLALLVNAVPLVGVLYFDWSAINVLVLYWFENLLIAVCTCVRLVLHRRWTRKRGYWRHSNRLGIKVGDKPAEMGLIGEYAIAAFVFTFGHGIFVGGIVLIMYQNYSDQPLWQVSLPQVSQGALAIAAMLGIELVVDLTRIRGASFAAMREYAAGRMSRIFVLHLAIIFGMMAMAMSNSPMGVLYVLIALKTVADLLGIATRGAPKLADSDTPPPAWTMRMADKLGKDKGGSAGLLKKWQEERAAAKRAAAEDEEMLAEPPS